LNPTAWVGPTDHFTVAKEENGTSRPWLLRTLNASRSEACMRAVWSACTITRCMRPRLGKSLM
jgi:hypothetical protein